MNKPDASLVQRIFLSHKKILEGLLVKNYISISHVGGTSIPGALTKGDVDIQIRASHKNITHIQKVMGVNYVVKNPEIWTDSFCVYKCEDVLPVDIIVVVENTEYDTHLKAREILMENPLLLQEYNDLKITLLKTDVELYRKKKYEFFKRITNNIDTP